MAEIKQTTVLIQSPPFNRISGKEGIDLALVCAAFDHQVNLVFIDLGIFHLKNNQLDDMIKDKLHDKQLNALKFYDIENMFVESESLQAHQLQQKNLIDSASLIDRKQINQLCQQSQHVFIY
ncbi:MAG: sulfurtransferase complex subunit TusC [Gammaproteobacteria bacterium]|nr:sulfurtransferase complex subunit TusC [Gammaproteobacteria bacterium]MDH5630681.1 sulfurtransferase complex subunit TusC [Gammaproteobacteria bacterium]